MVVLTINSNLLPFNPTQKVGFKQKQFFYFWAEVNKFNLSTDSRRLRFWRDTPSSVAINNLSRLRKYE
ncbi:hypothetical protein IFVP22_C1310035 [Vibrio parahaemolyticus]